MSSTDDQIENTFTQKEHTMTNKPGTNLLNTIKSGPKVRITTEAHATIYSATIECSFVGIQLFGVHNLGATIVREMMQ